MENKSENYFCDITGLPVTEKKQWVDLPIKNDYSISFRFVGDRILATVPNGELRHCDFEKQYHIRNGILDSELGANEPFVEILDCSKIRGAPGYGASKKRRDIFLRDSGRVLKFIAFNVSKLVKTKLVLGLAFNQIPYPFEIKKSYKEAVISASETVREYDKNNSLQQQKLKYDKDGEYISENLSVKIGFIGNWVMAGWVTGEFKSEDVLPVVRVQRNILASFGFSRKKYYRIMDLSKMTINDPSVITRYMRELRKMYVDCGRPLTTLLVGDRILLKKIFWKVERGFFRNVYFVSDVEDAFREIRMFETSKQSKRTSKSILKVGFGLVSNLGNRVMKRGKYRREIDELFYTIGSFSWDESDTGFPQVPLQHPFRKLYDSLELLWIDLKSMLRDQELGKHELQVAKEKAEQANITKSEFLANMSHEIRTPMNGILGMLDLLKETELTNEQQMLAESAFFSADSLLGILNDVLDYSKIEACKLNLEEINFSLREVLSGVGELLAIRSFEKNVEFICCVESAVPEFLLGDPGRLRQVLLNLGGNAIKFVEKGEVSIWVSCINETQESAVIRFVVKDTGIGIAKDKISDLFLPFSQVDSSTTRKYGGTGLGLSISKQITELMNGRIWVDSEIGKGSAFSLEIEFRKQHKDSQKDIDAFTSLDNMRVVVIEQNATSRKLFMEYLSPWDCRVTMVDTGENALDILAEAQHIGDPFAAVFICSTLPDMSGMDLGSKIRENKDHDDVTMVMVSPGGGMEELSDLKIAGFYSYLTKPIRQTLLYNCLTSSSKEAREIQESNLFTERLPDNVADLPAKKMNILIAEDNEMNQKVFSNMVGKMGHGYSIAENGEKAVSLYLKGSYDMILMDGNMPEMDGVQATKKIRKIEGTVQKKIPIVAVTANVMKGDRDKYIEAGMDDYLAKPVKKKELELMIDRFTQQD